MPSFPKPTFQFAYTVAAEVAALRQHKQQRQIPAKGGNTLLLGTWNIANFGEQERRDQDLGLIAELLSWFDVIAIQELKDNFSQLEDVVRKLGGGYAYLMSDVAGNGERAAYVYDTAKVTLLEKVGEIALPPKDLPKVKLPGVKQSFEGFDRTPYIATFRAGKLSFELVNVHLFFGSDAKKNDIDRRALEAFAVARWIDQREKSKWAFTRDIIALGDFNLPKTKPNDPIFKALTNLGLHLPNHSTKMGSNLASDKHYDQIAFIPGETQKDFTGKTGVFDFDAVVFATLWQQRGKADFNKYVKYYLSDHRPMWAEFRIA
jgi:endonuclease/exonuclease/phosphatase family metal-dependent hydrolase